MKTELNPACGSKEVLPVWSPIKSSDPLPAWLSPQNASTKYTEIVTLWKKGLLQMENRNYLSSFNSMGKIIEYIDEISEFSKGFSLELLEVVVLIHMSVNASGMTDLFKQKECLTKAEQILKRLNCMTDPAVVNLWGIVNYEIAKKACEMNFKSSLVHAVRFLRFALFGSGQAVDKEDFHAYNNFFWNSIALGCYFVGKLVKNEDLSKDCLRNCLAVAQLVENTKLLAELSQDVTQEDELEQIMSGNFYRRTLATATAAATATKTTVTNENRSASPNFESLKLYSGGSSPQPRLLSPLPKLKEDNKDYDDNGGNSTKDFDDNMPELQGSLHIHRCDANNNDNDSIKADISGDNSNISDSLCHLKLKVKGGNVNALDSKEKKTKITVEDEEDEEDWDKEFGFETKLEVNNIDTQAHKQILKVKDIGCYKISEKVSLHNMQVVMYPTPSKLYSLKVLVKSSDKGINASSSSTTTTKTAGGAGRGGGCTASAGDSFSGVDSYQPQEFEHWLRTLVEVHYNEKRIFSVDAQDIEVKEETKSLKEGFLKKKGCSIEWALRVVVWCRFLATKGESDLCWGLLDMLFRRFDEFVESSNSATSSGCCASTSTRQMQRALFGISWDALVISARVWSPKYDEQWKRMLDTTKSLYPAYMSVIDVVQCEMYSTLIMTRTPEELRELKKDKKTPLPDVMYAYVKLYEKARTSLKVTQSKGPLLTLGNALADIYLITSSIPPLLLSGTPGKYLDTSGVLTKFFHSEKAERAAKSAGIWAQEQQVDALQGIYAAVPCSPTKAKIAFVLGHYAALCGNNSLAESLLFEAIYLYENYTNGIPLLLSDLGLRVLQLFADVLRGNHKGLYAKAAYASATLLCQLQGKKEYFTVARMYAEVARENNDIDECIHIYEEIAGKYRAREKTWEIVYVNNVIADLNVERGHFLDAEKALRDSIAMIERFMAGNPCSQVWETRLKLAGVYLAGYTPERGVKCLEYILKSAPEWVLKQKGSTVWSLLATGYSRSGQIEETLHALTESLPPEAVTTVASLAHKKDQHEDSAQQQQTLLLLLLRYKKQFISAAFTLIHLYKTVHKPAEGLTACDLALELCDPVADALVMAKLYKRRGDILAFAYARSDTFTYPTTLHVDTQGSSTSSSSSSSPLPMPSNPQTFGRPTDILLEAAASYIRSHGIHSNAGNAIGAAGALSRLAVLYLNHILVPVTVFHEPLEKRLRVPCYETRAYDISRNVKDGEYVITLEEIEHITAKALNVSFDTMNLIEYPVRMLNAAELKLLQGDSAGAVAFWKECKDIVWGAFIDGTSLFIGSWPPTCLTRVVLIIERLARFTACMGGDFISKNFLLLDACIKAQDTLRDARYLSDVKHKEARSNYKEASDDLLRIKFERNNNNNNNNASATISFTGTKRHSVPASSISTPISLSPRGANSVNGSNGNNSNNSGGGRSGSAINPFDAISVPASPAPSGPSQQQQQQQPLPPLLLTTVSASSLARDCCETGVCGTCDYVDESTVQIETYNRVAEFMWCKFVYLKKQRHNFNSEFMSKACLTENMKNAFFECFHAANDLRSGVGVEVSIGSYGRISPEKSSGCDGGTSATTAASTVAAAAHQEWALNQRLKFDTFAARFPRIAQKIVYAIHFESFVMFYSPWTHLTYYTLLRKSECATHLHKKKKAGSKKGGGGSYATVKLCLLSNQAEYFVADVAQDLTLEDFITEICRMHNLGQFSHFASPRPKESSAPSAFRCMSVSRGFARELNAISEKLHYEFLQDPTGTISTPDGAAAKVPPESPKSYRLRARQLLLAVKPQRSSTRVFTCIDQSYRKTTVGDVLRKNNPGFSKDGMPMLYLYGSSSAAPACPAATCQGQYTPYSKGFMHLSKASIDYLSSFAFGASAPSKPSSVASALFSSSTQTTTTSSTSSSSSSSSSLFQSAGSSPQKDAAIAEITAIFNGLIDLLPIKNRLKKTEKASVSVEDLGLSRSRSASDESISATIAAATAASKKDKTKNKEKTRLMGNGGGNGGGVLRRESSMINSSSSSTSNDNSNSSSSSSSSSGGGGGGGEPHRNVLAVSKTPVIIICTRELHTIPWELVIPSFPVLRYFSFTDLLLAAKKTSWQTRIRYCPSYISILPKKDHDSDLVAREAVHKDLVAQGLDYLFRERPDPPVLGIKPFLPPFFMYPVPHNKAKLFRLKHREMTFVSLSDLEKNPRAFVKLITDNFTDSYPVIFVTHADLVCSNVLLTEVLKRRASCTVLAVPKDGLACVIDNMYQLYKPMCTIAATNKGRYLRNRYQFLLTTISIVMKRTSIPIAVVNSPLPV